MIRPRAHINEIKSLSDVHRFLQALEAGEDEQELREIGREIVRLLPRTQKQQDSRETVEMLRAFHDELRRTAARTRA